MKKFIGLFFVGISICMLLTVSMIKLVISFEKVYQKANFLPILLIFLAYLVIVLSNADKFLQKGV